MEKKRKRRNLIAAVLLAALAAGMALSIDVLNFDTSTRNSTSMIRAKIT